MKAAKRERGETMASTLRVGAAQIAPKVFDKAGTLQKTVRIIEEAGSLGLDLLVFPETYFAPTPTGGVPCPSAAPPSSSSRCS